MSVGGDHDLYVMMDVMGVQGSTPGPILSSRGPILVTFDDLNPGQVIWTTVPVFLWET